MRVICRRRYTGVCRGFVCVSDLCRRIYIGLCRGGVCAAVILVFAEEVSVRCLCRSYISLWRGGVCETDPCRRSYFGVCRGGVCVSDLWRRMSVSHKSVK